MILTRECIAEVTLLPSHLSVVSAGLTCFIWSVSANNIAEKQNQHRSRYNKLMLSHARIFHYFFNNRTPKCRLFLLHCLLSDCWNIIQNCTIPFPSKGFHSLIVTHQWYKTWHFPRPFFYVTGWRLYQLLTISKNVSEKENYWRASFSQGLLH